MAQLKNTTVTGTLKVTDGVTTLNNGSSYTHLNLLRSSTGNPVMKFSNSDGSIGTFGMSGKNNGRLFRYIGDTTDDPIYIFDTAYLDVSKVTAGTLPIANGGTGGTTKATARSNLGIGTIFGTSYQLTVTTTNANSWTVESCSAYLIGNQVRIYLNATRSSSTGAGNIDNIRICHVTFSGTHASKIGGLYNTTTGNGTGGGVCSLYTNDIDGLSFGIGISATHAAQSTVTTYFQMPCTIAQANY